MLINRFAILCVAAGISACATPASEKAAPADKVAKAKGGLHSEKRETTRDATSTAATLDGYKRALAERIAQVNSTHVYIGRPQALLRSVVVVKYEVDADGALLRSEILRSNRDRSTESTALASLRNAAPFPKPGSHLLRNGRMEIAETWLFNNDGRFQLRTIAEPQMDR